MKQRNYKSLVYFIAATIVATIGLQLYWNIQNYNTNKQRLINEVQISLDNGVEAYYSDLARTDIFAFVDEQNFDHDSTEIHRSLWSHFETDSAFIQIRQQLDSMNLSADIKGFTQILDSSSAYTAMKPDRSTMMSVFTGKGSIDSVRRLSSLTSKIIVSIANDTLNFRKLDTLFKEELNRKGIQIGYQLKHFDHDSIISSFTQNDPAQLRLSTYSKSTYLPESQKLQLFFSNPTLTILKRSLTGISLSFLLSACIIACLLYLLHTIKQQKELAEIKNDLISNITHEFKTPIATVTTAIEGIKNFNADNDKVKTDTYLDISGQQLKKLNMMVEKLLETATLDSDKLIVQKEAVDVAAMLQGLVTKYQMLAPEKEIQFKTNEESLSMVVDPFHFENAVANLIDNAIKYGGNAVAVNLNAMLNSVEITIADNGGKIDKNQRSKIFDKFYRIPTGNRHDVKGFGIGLFYSKKIIAKHDGQLTLEPDPVNTVFKIRL